MAEAWHRYKLDALILIELSLLLEVLDDKLISIRVLVTAEVDVWEPRNYKGVLLYKGVRSKGVRASWCQVPHLHGKLHDLEWVC